MERIETHSSARTRTAAAWVAMTLAALASAGCTTFANRESPLPRDGATMDQVYRNHMGGGLVDGGAGAGATPRDRLPARGADDDAVVAQRRALSEPLNNRFERLPNPDLTMHVFAHLAPGRYPVPGYDTVFPMYDTVQYAMPGEVAPRHQAGDAFTSSAPATGRLAPPDGDGQTTSTDDQRKRHTLLMLDRLSPTQARLLTEYDRLYALRCGARLTSDQLMLVPASGSPAYNAMTGYAAVGRENDGLRVGASLMGCDTPQGQVAPAPSTTSSKAARREPS